jgi:hypothetical protein
MKGPTAYMLFSEEQRPDIMSRLRAEAPDGKVAVTVVAKVIGELWKGLSDSDKAAYKEKAHKRAIGTHPRLYCSFNMPCNHTGYSMIRLTEPVC